MIISKKSPLTGRWNAKDIDVTPEELRRWQSGELIQNVMPHLSPDDREFLMTGLTPADWDEMTGAE